MENSERTQITFPSPLGADIFPPINGCNLIHPSCKTQLNKSLCPLVSQSQAIQYNVNEFCLCLCAFLFCESIGEILRNAHRWNQYQTSTSTSTVQVVTDSTIQYKTVQESTRQYKTVQDSTRQEINVMQMNT